MPDILPMILVIESGDETSIRQTPHTVVPSARCFTSPLFLVHAEPEKNYTLENMSKELDK